jgi:hypothetical protein
VLASFASHGNETVTIVFGFSGDILSVSPRRVSARSSADAELAKAKFALDASAVAGFDAFD